MAQHGAGTACEHRGPPPSLFTDHSMPDGIDAAVHDVKPAAVHTMVDRRGPEPERDELRTGDNAALAVGEDGDVVVGCELASHTSV